MLIYYLQAIARSLKFTNNQLRMQLQTVSFDNFAIIQPLFVMSVFFGTESKNVTIPLSLCLKSDKGWWSLILKKGTRKCVPTTTNAAQPL